MWPRRPARRFVFGKSFILKGSMAKETTGSWLSTIKWIAILLTMMLLSAVLYKAYRVASAPVRGVTSAADAVKEQADQIANRLEVDIVKDKTFDQLAETAFNILNAYPVRKPVNINERLFWAQNLRSSNHQVCRFDYDFGTGSVPIYAAANNETYATAKAVGSKENRVIRVHVITGSPGVGLRAYWDQTEAQWKMRWRRVTFNKSFNDETARMTLRKVLSAIPDQCSIKE